MGSPNQPSQATPSYNAPAGGGNVLTSLGISTTTVVKKGAGAVIRAIVTVAGSTGGIYDCTATASAVTANQIAVLPNSVGPIDIEFPCMIGIFVVPGSGQQVAVSYQ